MTEEEYGRLSNLYLNAIYRIAWSGCRNRQDAEDITQEVFEALLKRQGSFASDEHAKHWLIRVAVNKCNSLWRNPWKRRVELSEQEIMAEAAIVDGEYEGLYAALRKLPPKYAQILHLYYFEDMRIKEIAETVGISETAVSTRLQRAREKVRTFLEGSSI